MKRARVLILCLILTTLVPVLEAQKLDLGSSPASLVTLAPYSASEFPVFQKMFRAENAGVVPAAFVVSNGSGKAVIGIAIEWIATSNDGSRSRHTSRTHSYLSPSNAPLVGAGGRMLVAPDTFVPESILQAEGGVMGSFPSEETNSQFASASKIHAEIDCVIFEDGEVAGPNHLGLVSAILTRKMAAEEVVKQVDVKRSRGEDPSAVLLELSQRSPADAVGKHASHFAVQLLRSQHFDAELAYLRNIPYPPKFFRKDGGPI